MIDDRYPMGFNPCCGGSGSLGAHLPTRESRGSADVSILVVVDRARWVESSRIDRFASCFNPCCGGSGSLGTYSSGTRQARPRWFQSLLWWIGLAGAESVRCGLMRASGCFNPCCGGSGSLGRGLRGALQLVFQSLLWWIGLAGTKRGGSPEVSILVVVDRARWVASCRSLDSSARMFQSLLWWIGLAGAVGDGGIRRVVRSFNPCCGGSGSLGPAARRRTIVPPMFQSLLWWIGLAGAGSRRPSGR